MIGKGFMGIGEYPPDYVRKVHGPYDPSRYYGKPDTPFGEVKIGELPAWLGRRSWSPLSMGRAMSRAYHHWARKYVHVRYGTAAPLFQFAVTTSFVFYLINYNVLRNHSHAKYH